MSPPAKEVKKDPKVEPAPPAQKQITITIPDFNADLKDPKRQFRLALLVVLAIVFIAALFMFTRSSFAVNDVFDVSRLQYNIVKLYSISFILFIVLYSLAVALAVYYGFGASRLEAGLATGVILLLALVSSAFAWAYAYAFIGFGASLCAAAILAAFRIDQGISSAWGVVGQALLILLILAAVSMYIKVNSNSAAYTDSFIAGISAAAPDMVNQMLPGAASAGASQLSACSQLLDQLNFTPGQIKQVYPQSLMTNAINVGGGAAYQALAPGVQANVSSAAYEACAVITAQAANSIKTQASSAIKDINVTSAVQGLNASSIITPRLLRQTIQSVPALSQALSFLPVIAALMIISLMSIFNLLVHVIAVIFVWVLSKAI